MTMDWEIVFEHRDALLNGVEMTIFLAVATMAFALPLGLLVAQARMSCHVFLRMPATIYVEIFRSTPLVLQIYWAFYVMPVALGIRLDAVSTALLGLTLNVTAYNCETFRAGLVSIRRGQTNAALALGMTGFQAFRIVILPQAVRRVLPALASTWISLFKDTSLVSVISVADLAYTSMHLRSQTFRVFEFLSVMAGLYWLMGYPQAKVVDWLYKKYRVTE
ncbi:amino acid ABC transporter permease [Agrobacterium sp. LAD9]|uniref:amino acid ABC transporter permease n=1 Tax=Agrobacterium sp. LAD9 TaxID=2055153 RepID=UPI000D1F88DB|nr:amino acid ABC transporter permease [Agrobacterium sp. LAD9]